MSLVSLLITELCDAWPMNCLISWASIHTSYGTVNSSKLHQNSNNVPGASRTMHADGQTPLPFCCYYGYRNARPLGVLPLADVTERGWFWALALCTDFMYMFIAFSSIYNRNQKAWYTFIAYPVLWRVRSLLEERLFQKVRSNAPISYLFII
jgi:hypothetical protein